MKKSRKKVSLFVHSCLLLIYIWWFKNLEFISWILICDNKYLYSVHIVDSVLCKCIYILLIYIIIFFRLWNQVVRVSVPSRCNTDCVPRLRDSVLKIEVTVSGQGGSWHTPELTLNQNRTLLNQRSFGSVTCPRRQSLVSRG